MITRFTLILLTLVLCSSFSTGVNGKGYNCYDQDRVRICIEEYDPVCGYNLIEGIAQTYTNGCLACQDEDVIVYVDEPCPYYRF